MQPACDINNKGLQLSYDWLLCKHPRKIPWEVLLKIKRSGRGLTQRVSVEDGIPFRTSGNGLLIKVINYFTASSLSILVYYFFFGFLFFVLFCLFIFLFIFFFFAPTTGLVAFFKMADTASFGNSFAWICARFSCNRKKLT